MIAIVQGIMKPILLKSVLHAPELKYNLISIPQLRRNGFWVSIGTGNRDPKFEIREPQHIKSEDAKMIGIETKDELYEAVVRIYMIKAYIATGRGFSN